MEGLQTIIDYKRKHSRGLPSDTSLPDELNYFYACFEANSTETCMRAPAVPENCVITLSAANVSKIFKQVNIRKAAVMKCITRTFIFNLSLSESVKPTNQTTIVVPVLKNTKVTYLNYYRPIALTSAAMKGFESLVMAHINTIIPETLDPLQFAYHLNRSTDDAISIALHTALSHLDKRNTYSGENKYLIHCRFCRFSYLQSM